MCLPEWLRLGAGLEVMSLRSGAGLEAEWLRLGVGLEARVAEAGSRVALFTPSLLSDFSQAAYSFFFCSHSSFVDLSC